jgi:hypothetical protein
MARRESTPRAMRACDACTQPPEDASRATRASTSHGGQGGSEDSTRAAGYIVDLHAVVDRPPGPEIAKDPRLLDGARTDSGAVR